MQVVEVNCDAQLETMRQQQDQLQQTIADAKREARKASPAVAELVVRILVTSTAAVV